MGSRLITIILLTTLLSSCNRFQILCDSSFSFERCRCRCYDTESLRITKKQNCKKDWDKYFGGTPEVHPVNYDIMYCDEISGFKTEEVITDIIPDVKEYRAYCEDLGGN